MSEKKVLNMEVKEKEIHLKDYFHVIKKRKKIAAVFFFITFITVIMGTISSKPLYNSFVKLKVEKNSANPLRGDFGYMGYDPEFLQTQTEIINSKSVAEKVVKSLDLVNKYSVFFPEKKDNSSLTKYIKDYIKSLIKSIVKKNDKPEKEEIKVNNLEEVYFADDNSPEAQMADVVRAGIKVSPMQQSKIINVSYTSGNPVFSALVVNSIAKAYIERILEMRMENIGYTLEWMKKKASEERVKLESSEIKLQQYLNKKDIVTIEDRIAIIPQKLAQISTELTKAEYERQRLEEIIRMIEKTRTGNLGSVPVIATNNNFQEIRKKIFYKEQELLELGQKYGEKHPVIIRLKKEIESLEQNKKNEMDSIIQEAKNDYSLALSNEHNLNEQLKTTKNEAARLNEEFVQYKILQREVETNKQLYQALVTRIKEQTITKQTRNVDVWVIEKGKVSSFPFNQNMKRNILLGLVLGLFGGIGLAFFLEYLDNRISTAEDAEEKTGLPVLGSIGLIPGDESERQNIIVTHPMSAHSEAYKSIRASLFLATSSGLPFSLVITSNLPGEGKTLTSINIAISMAIAGKKVLLVDADMRKPKIHSIFNLENEKGFSGILSGEDFKKGFVLKSEINNLFILCSGKKPVNPSELLSSDIMEKILNAFAKNFDMVIFDTPPAGIVSDAVVLGHWAEKIILVTKSGQTKYEDVHSCLKKLSGIENKVIGQIVNAVDMKKQGYHENYYYSEYYQ